MFAHGHSLQYSEAVFMGTGSAVSSIPVSAPHSSESTGSAPVQQSTTFGTSARINYVSAPPAASTPAPTTPGFTAKQTETTPGASTTASSSGSSDDNGNDVGRLSGGIIALIGSVASVVALVVSLFIWCGYYKNKRSSKWC